MTKKKTTAKKKVQNVKMHDNFELGEITQELRETYKEYLMIMINTQGWKLMTKILEGNLATIESAIITKIDPHTQTMMSETDVDEYRIQHTQIKTLLSKPHELIEQFSGKQKVGMPVMYDPYQQEVKEKEESTPARTLTTE